VNIGGQLVVNNKLTLEGGKKVTLFVEGKVWEWVTETPNGAKPAVKRKTKSTATPTAPSAVQKLRILKEGFVGMPKGTLCDVVSVDDNNVTLKGGKKAAFSAEDKWWERVTETQSDARPAVKRKTKSAPTPKAPSTVQQLRILQDKHAGMASGTLCNVVSFEANNLTLDGGKKVPLCAEGKLWEWVTETQSDARPAVKRKTKSAPTPKAPSTVQQLRILEAGFAGMARGTLCDVVSFDKPSGVLTLQGGKKALRCSKGKQWEWVTETQSDAPTAVDRNIKSAATHKAPSSVQQLRILQDGFAGMASGTLCNVVRVDDKYVTMEGGKRASLGNDGKGWEWVTETQSDATPALKRETMSTATPTAPSAVQQLRILEDGFAGMASGTLCNVVSVDDNNVTLEGGKKSLLSQKGRVWEWAQTPARSTTGVEESRSDTEPREAQKSESSADEAAGEPKNTARVETANAAQPQRDEAIVGSSQKSLAETNSAAENKAVSEGNTAAAERAAAEANRKVKERNTQMAKVVVRAKQNRSSKGSQSKATPKGSSTSKQATGNGAEFVEAMEKAMSGVTQVCMASSNSSTSVYLMNKKVSKTQPGIRESLS
jgi:hypothetical protein